MAEEKLEPRELNLRQWLPWTVLFRGFQVAMDPKKLLLAAAGILTMALGWWLLAVIFFGAAGGTAPNWESGKYDQADAGAWAKFKRDRKAYNLLYRAAAPNDGRPAKTDAGDLADRPDEYKILEQAIASGKTTIEITDKDKDSTTKTFVVREKPRGELRTWPWFENRGQNPFLIVVGQRGHEDAFGSRHFVPWEKGHFWDWLFGNQLPILLEPLVKFLKPVYLFLSPDAGIVNQFYFFLVILWTVATWSIFGGAITRMAVVQLARNEKVSLGEALRFVWSRRLSYFFASLAPMIIVGAVAFLLFLFGIGNLIPVFAEVWNGVLFPLVILGGLAMAVALFGMIGWPMIHATLSAEGSDSFDALSRSYSYVYQAIWSYLWYAFVAVAYGAVVVFFVSFMGSLTIYLGKWGMSQTFADYFNRNPSYMFVWAPTSYEWRTLLTEGSTQVVDQSGEILNQTDFKWWNWIGTFCVTVWTYLIFLMVIGFGYSYFWTACTTIYLLMRRKVDDTELDEVYLEEDDAEDSYTSTTTAPPAAATGTPLAMVDPPALRTPVAAASPAGVAGSAPAVEPTPPAVNPPSDGNMPPSPS